MFMRLRRDRDPEQVALPCCKLSTGGRCSQDVVHEDSITERHRAIVPHLNLTPEQRLHLVDLRAAYLVKSAMVQRQRDAAVQLLTSTLPVADFMSQVSIRDVVLSSDSAQHLVSVQLLSGRPFGGAFNVHSPCLTLALLHSTRLVLKLASL